MPFSTLSHGSLYPAPRLSSSDAPYRTGQSITITCFGDAESRDAQHVHTCLSDGWDSEVWPDCTPSVPSRGTSSSRTGVLVLGAVYLVLVL